MSVSKYSKGKIYKIVSDHCDEVYIGSTIQPLERRISDHESGFKHFMEYGKKYCCSFEVLQYGDYIIEKIEEYPCNTQQELCRREGFFVRKLICVNDQIPGRTSQEHYIDNKERILARNRLYRENNIEMVREKKKIYHENNKEKLSKQKKIYRDNNKVKKSKTDKLYRENNKETINARKKARKTCECGSVVGHDIMARHRKTKKHISLMELKK